MKTLLVLRHGKSDWNVDYGGDHDRPLAPRGVKAAKWMGVYLERLEQIPDRVVSSTAVRARETVRLAAQAGNWSSAQETTSRLYGASPEEALDVVRALDDALGSVLLAGHEPTWSLLVGGLIGNANVRFPTGAMARVDLAVRHWNDADFGLGTLIWLATPKQIGRLI